MATATAAPPQGDMPSNLKVGDQHKPARVLLTRGFFSLSQFQKRRPLDDVPGLKLDVELTGRRAIIKVEACGHTLVFDDLTRENDIDRDSEKWEVTFGTSPLSPRSVVSPPPPPPRWKADRSHVAASRPRVEQDGDSSGKGQDSGSARLDLGNCPSTQSECGKHFGNQR